MAGEVSWIKCCAFSGVCRGGLLGRSARDRGYASQDDQRDGDRSHETGFSHERLPSIESYAFVKKPTVDDDPARDAFTNAGLGYAKRLHKRHPEAVFASYLVRLRLRPEIDSLMVGIFVESTNYRSYVQSRVGGAAQPNANAKVLSAAEILLPPPSIQRVFHESVKPLMDQREVLQLQNQQLRTARDLLLPRLMSGKIAV